MKLLVINPGSTSTKIGVYTDEVPVFDKTLRHESGELSGFQKITDQHEFRKGVILKSLAQAGIGINELDAVVGRGGLVKPLEGGTYFVNDAMIRDLRLGVQGEHASNLGGLIAHEIATEIKKPAFVVDPVVVDEMDPVSRISGHPWIERKSIFHALNQKAIARQYCKDTGKSYFDSTLIVAHMGGGISVGIHHKGHVIDVNNALSGEGPFSPERSGALPVGDLTDLCFGGKTKQEIKKAITGQGGMVAYFGSNDMMEIEEKAKTDERAALVLEAMIYQIAKEIAAVSVAVCGNVEAVLLTGGLAYSKRITDGVSKRVSFISKVSVYPGEHELLALVQGALRVLHGEEEGKEYK